MRAEVGYRSHSSKTDRSKPRISRAAIMAIRGGKKIKHGKCVRGAGKLANGRGVPSLPKLKCLEPDPQ